MNGREKITAKDRRDIVLAVLFEGEPQAALARQHGITRSHVSRLIADARNTPRLKLRDAQEGLEAARDEVRFRKRVIAILNGDTLAAARGEVGDGGMR